MLITRAELSGTPSSTSAEMSASMSGAKNEKKKGTVSSRAQVASSPMRSRRVAPLKSAHSLASSHAAPTSHGGTAGRRLRTRRAAAAASTAAPASVSQPSSSAPPRWKLRRDSTHTWNR